MWQSLSQVQPQNEKADWIFQADLIEEIVTLKAERAKPKKDTK